MKKVSVKQSDVNHIGCLPREQADALVLTSIGGKTARVAARILGMAVGVLQAKASLAQASLAKFIQTGQCADGAGFEELFLDVQTDPHAPEELVHAYEKLNRMRLTPGVSEAEQKMLGRLVTFGARHRSHPTDADQHIT